MFRIVPYKRGSSGAKMLATKLAELSQTKVLRGRPSKKCKNILWGSNTNFRIASLQKSDAVDIAKNKLSTFIALKEKGVSIPEFTTSKADAEAWIQSGISVFARQLLNASEGRGIVVCKELPLVDAPLYVKLVKKDKEFRVHVFNGEVIDLQEKRRRRNVLNPDGSRISGVIRNIGNNWVFCRKDINEPNGLRELGVAAVNALGLLFGAVDIVYNSRTNVLKVLEVNTAPGLCDSTATSYAQAIMKLA